MSYFYTIPEHTESLYKDKGSKFIALTFRIGSEEEVKERLKEVKKKYHDARHHCFAWILGLDDQTTRANDDGEPSHSAGDPILGQIRSHNLTNVLVVVVRYFGGIKLGVGGLIHAYKTAANDALLKAGKEQVFEMRRVEFLFEYPQMSVVERLITDFKVDVIERDFMESCKISGTVKKNDIVSLRMATKEMHNIKISIQDEHI